MRPSIPCPVFGKPCTAMHINLGAQEAETEGPEVQAHPLQSKFEDVLNEALFRKKKKKRKRKRRRKKKKMKQQQNPQAGK